MAMPRKRTDNRGPKYPEKEPRGTEPRRPRSLVSPLWASAPHRKHAFCLNEKPAEESCKRLQMTPLRLNPERAGLAPERQLQNPPAP